MYLKSLVLQGFKSFAQRVELVFPKGVTAIVGPNGSGKSNVSDAIRWVLGEQNIRSLRGSALQDVIFAGTGSRKPLGMAEVSLTLDNSDFALPLEYAEVTLTRRTYRSGESEFFINRTPCRLRDIQELLMDTGLGRGTLSVIGQGEVDAILSVRPEERRALIEEAAGITRYRTKRQAALDRLSETEADLVRVNDIIAEVERQLTPLEREAERAKLYRALRSELQTVERQILLHDWAVRKEALQLWDGRRDEAAAALEEAKAIFAQVQQRRQNATRLHAEVQERVAEAQRVLAELERSGEQYEAQARVLAERLSALQGEEKRYAEDLASVAADQKRVEDERARLQDEKVARTKAADEAEKSFHEAEEELLKARARLDEGSAVLQALRNQALSQFQKAADVQSELKRMALAVEERGAELQHKREQLNEIDERLKSTQAERQSAQAEVDELERVRNDLSHVLSGMQEGIAELEAARKACVDSLQSLQARLTKVRSQRDALQELEASYEGYQEGVRACLQAAEPWRSKVYGAVGTLLEALPEHEVALEVALGAATQNIVVADEESAKAAIEYLKATRAGRVTFLPLNSLRVSAPVVPNAWMLEDDEYVGIASELVRYDPAIQRAVEYLLGRVLVTRTLTGAIRLNRRHPQINRVVSLDGDLVLAAGPITGGHGRRRAGSGMLSRSRRLAELSEEVEGLTLEVRKEQQRLAELDATLTEAINERSAVEGRLQSVLRQIAEKQRVSDILRERVQALSEERTRALSGIAKDETALERLRSEHEAARLRLGSLDTDKERQDTEVTRLEEELGTLRAECDALEDVRSERRAAWVDASAALKRVESELQRVEEELEQLASAFAKQQQEAELVKERLAATSRAHDEALAQAALCRKQAEEHKSAAASLLAELDHAQKQVDQAQLEEEKAREEVEAAGESLHKVELATERERVAYQQAEERLLEHGIETPTDSTSVKLERVEPLRLQAKDLRKRLEALGDVNVNALDEFAALKERYNFLVTQRDDLLEAREGLDKAIADMDATSRERLVAAFSAIQKALHEVFPRLFGGGRAEISWTDPDNPLEAGIEMLVQPPGKRPQPLLTLSGGERALAAASLMFAIMTVRPSPFFVLDEVDAALDEANVDRFAQLLQEYGRSNQIIVITHRQGTMERADALFGVTMERHGSSQLVSLRVDEALKAAPAGS